ncbi:hypothetical protein ACFQ48_15880 [Hymenobacter caeli]|uniref:Gliding motility-associated C-terminal domain-containing protein n=1 Tax=Hymenobacter caeli TaxID=2735894 RepID=A0ABX2FUR3_9BACT|nr:hypothetical protein [Hymenobacter caeli]NRT20568.1 hypothetical protein [Hymenobacter caeli]
MLITALCSSSNGWAQVANDNIENRRVLKLNETITSNTTGCTVQRSCVDERLTGQCIQYHNDQWFEFTPAAAGRYFVNIGGQRCRDVRGVQLVVLSGQPCQPATYQVLSCTSLGTQDDVFVALENLQAGQPYLLDVDGYLKDFCQFTLQVSGRAVGVPAVPPPASLAGALPGTSRVVQVAWALPDSLAGAPRCRVLRREQHEFRSAERHRVPVTRNSYGGRPAAYAVADTLPRPGYYLYQVVADAAPNGLATPVLLKQFWVAYSQLNPLLGPLPTEPHLELPLGKYPRRASLSVLVTDAVSGRVLLNKQLVNQPNAPKMGWVDISQWQAAGVRKVAVEIVCHPLRGRFSTDRLLFDVPPVAAP